MDIKRQQKAVATAREYDQGNIAGLDGNMTRRLVASTVYTESNGGDLTITNRQGYIGRYQAGAGWLADAGYVDQDKLRSAMAGYKSEWSWAESGGMTRFLQDASNWKGGLNLEKYKQSADLQDQAFKRNCDAAFHQAVRKDLLNADDDPERIAGFLKARHIAGYAGAKAVLQGKPPREDANGTSNYDYYNDIAKNRDGLDQVLKGLGQATSGQNLHRHEQLRSDPLGDLGFGGKGEAVIQLQRSLASLGYHDATGHPLKLDHDFGLRTAEAVKAFQRAHGLHVDGVVGVDTRAALAKAERSPLLSEKTHPDNLLFQQAKSGLMGLHGTSFRSEADLDRVSAALASTARQVGLGHIDHVMMNTRGDRVIAVQGNPQDPARQIASVDKTQAIAQPLEQSTSQLAVHVTSQSTAQVHAQSEHVEYRAGLSMGMRP